MNCLHFFPLEKVLFTTSTTFWRGKKSSYNHIVDSSRGKKRHVPHFLHHVMIYQPFLAGIFNFYLLFVQLLAKLYDPQKLFVSSSSFVAFMSFWGSCLQAHRGVCCNLTFIKVQLMYVFKIYFNYLFLKYFTRILKSFQK